MFSLSETISWLGLTSLSLDSGYSWSDGSPLDMDYWGQGEPNNANDQESCASINTAEGSADFFNIFYFFCQFLNPIGPGMTKIAAPRGRMSARSRKMGHGPHRLLHPSRQVIYHLLYRKNCDFFWVFVIML